MAVTRNIRSSGNSIFDLEEETRKQEGQTTNTVRTAIPSAQDGITVSLPKTTARQRMMLDEEDEDKWYRGTMPTSSETLARIFTIGKSDPQQGQELFDAFTSYQNDPSTPYYNPYSRATNHAIDEIAALGVDTSGGIGSDWLQRNASLMSSYRLGTGTSPLAPSSKSTREQNAAYWYYKIADAEETTQKAETEWDALQEEIAYWVGRSDRNYSDDEILSRIDWSQYKTLTAMDEARQKGTPMTLNRAIGYSQDALYGAIWAARNGGGTGNPMIDGVKAALGEGNQWQENTDISGRLDPTSDRYNPYSVGATLDDAALYFGVSSFDQTWLDGNRAYLAGNDKTAKKYYSKVYDAEQTTQKAEAELEQLRDRIEYWIGYTDDADMILDGLLDDFFGDPALTTLKKMDESRKSGDLLATTRAIDYRWEDVEAEVRRRCAAQAEAKKADAYVADVTSALGAQPTSVTSVTGDNGTARTEPAVGTQTGIAISEAMDKAIASAGSVIGDIGTSIERMTWKLARSADIVRQISEIELAVENGTTDAQTGYESSLEAADAFAGKNYIEAREKGDEDTLAAITGFYEVVDRMATLTGAEQNNGTTAIGTLDHIYLYKDYTPTNWNAYSMYDTAIAFGSSIEDVTEAAKTHIGEMEAEIDRIDEDLAYINSHMLVLNGDIVENLNRARKELSDGIQDARYFILSGNEDFDSVVEKTKQDVMNQSIWKRRDVDLYAVHPEWVDSDSGIQYFEFANQRERDTYLYLLGKEGQEAADAYYGRLTDEENGILLTRRRQTINARNEKLTKENAAAAAGMSAASVLVSPLQMLGVAYSNAAALFGKEINPNSPMFDANNAIQTIRGTTKEMITKEFGEGTPLSFFANLGYDALMSTGDSTVSALIGGSPAMGTLVISTESASSAIMEAKQRGATNCQALALGGINFLAEYATEKIPMDEWFDIKNTPPKTVREFFTKMAKQSATEGIEEAISGVVESVSDKIIMESLSNYDTRVAYYVNEEKLSEEQAQKKALADTIKEIAYGSLAGAVSGSFGTVTATVTGKLTGKSANPAAAESLTTERANLLTRKQVALAQAMTTEDASSRTASLAAVVMKQGGDSMDAAEANAAAQFLMSMRRRQQGVIATIQKILMTAAENGVDDEQMASTLRVAALSDGDSHNQLQTMMDNGVTPEGVNSLIEAAKQDAQDADVQKAAGQKVLDVQIADRVKALIADGALSGLRSYEEGVSKARSELRTAQKGFSTAANDYRVAGENLESLQAQWAQNPSDAALNGKMQQAVKDVGGKAVVAEQYKQSVENAQEKADQAQKVLDAEREEAMKRIREQARQDVLQEREQAETERAQKEEQAVIQRDIDNANTLDAETYIDEKYPDAPEEKKQQIRNLFAETAKRKQASEDFAARDRLARSISRRFSVDIQFLDRNDPKLNGNSAGYSRKGNTIYMATDATRGDVVRSLFVHELTHRAEQSKAYNALKDSLLAWKYGDNADQQNADRDAIYSLYKNAYESAGRGAEFETDGNSIAESEQVARIAEELLGADDDTLIRLVSEKPSLARQMVEALKGVIDRFRGVNDPEVENLRRVESLMRKALDDVERKRRSEYRAAAKNSSHPGGVQFSVSQLAEATGLDVRMNDDGVPYSLIDKDGNEVTNVTPDMLKSTPVGNLIRAAQTVGTINQATADAQMKLFADLATLAAQYKDQAMVWEIAGSQMFSAIKDNSDKQYGTTVDFGTICAKTQAIVDVMSETMVKLGRGLTREEVIDAYRETAGVGYNVPCPVCYVFSRWMGVPSLLGNMAEYQRRFDGMSESDVRAYVADVESRYSDGSGKPSSAIAKAKTKIEGKLARIEKKMLQLTAQGKSVESLVKQAKPLEDELSYIEAYNWVTQVLCKKNVRDANGQVVLDPDYTPVPDEILLDLRRTGDFANDKYKKSWTYRTTRGAGMGKAILPHSGARIGDTVKGTKDRWADIQNAFLTGDDAQAQRSVENAIRRMKAQNLIGGQRFQSTSDYRPEWGIDYMMTFLEMQAIGAKGQLYTKVIEAVDMFATAGIEVNLSIMPKGNGWHVDENGNKVLDFSSVTGIDFDQAYEKTKQYDNVQMILVGINDEHINLAMADDRIGFIIPWHASGNSGETLTAMMDAVGEKVSRTTDYTKSQSDKENSKATQAQKDAMDLRMRILTGDTMKNGLTDSDQRILDSNPYLADLYHRFCVDETAEETYGVALSAKQASQVFPFEYWDTSLTVDQADENGRRFREYCESIGLKPRFPQFADKPGYWKLLIDRSMYNLDGTYHQPKQIDVTGVEIGSVAQSVGEVKYGDSAKTSEAVQAVLDDIRARLPADQYADGEESDMQYSLRPVSPVEQKTTDENGDPAWVPGHSEQWFRDNGYPIYADVPAEQAKADGSSADGHGTQISSTKSTYKKIFSRLKEQNPTGWQDMKVLDASSGLGIGTRIGRNMGFDVDDIEPFPSSTKYGLDASEFGEEPEGSFYPNYTDYSGLQDMVENGEKEQYDYIISNAVLNVIPQDTRDNLVSAMASLLKPGGQMFINVISRNYQGAVDSKAETQYLTGKNGKQTPVGSVRTQEGDYREKGNTSGRGHETFVWKSNSVQKVFSTNELMAYLQDALGDGYTVKKDALGMTGVTVQKANSDIQYALPDNDLISRDINNWMDTQNTDNSNGDGDNTERPMRERQFATQTAQRSQAIPQWLKNELLSDPNERYYEADTNNDQIVRSWERLQTEGYEAMRERLLAADATLDNADDVADANMLMAMANREGDMQTLLDIARHYNKEGTRQAKAFQARKIFSRMTPAGVRALAAGDCENRLGSWMDGHQPAKRSADRKAEKTSEQIRQLQGGDELLRLEAASEYTITRMDARYGVPINEQQRELIRQFGLENVNRPVFYNKATREQRMLEAILMEPNPLNATGFGLNLVERLTYCQAGAPVIFNSDLDYIGYNMAQFASAPLDEQEDRFGDLALSRVYEAYGNITEPSLREKLRTWKYTSMLLSLPSAGRNVIGNAAQNTVNAASHSLAAALDTAIGQITGRRTRANITIRELAGGWNAFVRETVNTYRDYFVDRAVTQRGDDRFNLNQRGRVYQNNALETLRTLESFLMSVGDRNFWRMAYANSMAEQQRVARLNGEEFDFEAANERAQQDANFATFTEDSAVRDGLAALKRVPVLGDVLDILMPFTGVPTNIIGRMWQYSPAGLAEAVIRHGYRGITGQTFDQGAFVDSMARGLTGTAMFGVGMLLRSLAAIKLGTGDEDDKKVYGVRSAQGDQYSPYIQLGDDNISLAAFSPAASALTMGAVAYDTLKDSDDAIDALMNACFGGLDQIFDASYMTALQDLFNGVRTTGSFSESAANSVFSNVVSQNVPSLLGQLATALDPYVRDTKDRDAIMQAIKTGIVNKVPGLRQMLPEKVDVAGRSVTSKEGLANFFDPLNRTKVASDPALTELMRLNETLGTSDFMPSDALSGTKTALTGVAEPVEGKDKEAYRKRYGELWRLGGATYDANGQRVTIQGVDSLIRTSAYQGMSDEEKANAIGGIVSAAKTGATYEMGEKLGHIEKAEKSSGYAKKPVRAMPEQFADSDSPMIKRLADKYEETGDGAFIPKGISSRFSVNKVSYSLEGEEYDLLWSLYEKELNGRLKGIDWMRLSDEELAAAVESAYSSAATAAKNQYAKKHK